MNTNEFALELIEQAARQAAARNRLPEATYRLQFHAGFTFRDAIAIVPYLRDLGITHCYASPYLKAAAGSTHGYDVVDFGSINPEIGSAADFDAWTSALEQHGLGQIVDFVPNHMGVGTGENGWWNDVLENGPAARFASYFDIAWHASSRPALQNKVLLPVLAEPYGDVLEAGQLRLGYADGAFTIAHGTRYFPVAPASYSLVLGCGIEEWAREVGDSDPAVVELKSILTAIRNLPDRAQDQSEKLAELERESKVIKGRLNTLYTASEPARRHLDGAVVKFNGQTGDPRSFDLLEQLLEQQCYRLAYWRVAPDEINYRRFFDVNGLAALSMEREEVFEAAHALILRWLAEGRMDGVRIDHPDGLYDPAQYFHRLQERYRLACARNVFETGHAHEGLDWSDLERPLRALAAQGAGGAWERAGGPSLYVLAEKILGTGESLVESWPVAGTTGYEFLNQVNGLFVDRDGRAAFDHLYRGLVEDDASFAEVVYRSKKLILEVSLSSELHMLTGQLDRLAEKARRSRDFTFNTLRQALSELIACFPVYRSYIDDRGSSEPDRRYINVGVRRASGRNPLLSRRVFRFIRDLLLGDGPGDFDRGDRRRFAGKFQQVTSPVAAKGMEDTAFYVYNRLVSLNEVGGDPATFGSTADEYHGFSQARQARWPFALSPLSTHDTKRSEDVRARINVLSELPEEWFGAVNRWRRWNAHLRPSVDDLVVPDSSEEYLLYQTLAGAWPLELADSAVPRAFVDRIQNYMVKAGHEAKRHSSWINPDPDYDHAIRKFVSLILDERSGQPFLDDFRTFQRKVSHFGLLNSLGQTLLKLVSPGVADTFQGSELWDFSLVDPDNRRPVDYVRRQRMLFDLKQAIEKEPHARTRLCRELVAGKDDARIKLFLHHLAFGARRDHPGLFSTGDYRPVTVKGEKSANVLAFSRGSGETRALVAIPRLWVRLLPDPSLTSETDPGSTPPDGAREAPSRDHGASLRSPDFSSSDALVADWLNTRLVLNDGTLFLRWYNVFTGEVHTAAAGDATSSLPCAELFGHFPVALLLNDPLSGNGT